MDKPKENRRPLTGLKWKPFSLAAAAFIISILAGGMSGLQAAGAPISKPGFAGYQNENSSDAPAALISLWNMPVFGSIPLNLVLDLNGNAWFTAANSDLQDFVLGKLDPVAETITVWKSLVGVRRIHYLDRDAAGNIWYLTTYAYPSGSTPDVLGKYDPAANTFTEYTSSAMVGLFGLEVDRAAGEIWFLGSEPVPSIFRFSIATSTMTAWPAASLTSLHDLAIDPQGDVWVSDVPWLDDIQANSSLLKLAPSSGVLTLFPLPDQARAPFKLSAANSGEIWVSEYPAGVNGLARLDLTNKAYEQFTLSAAGSYPSGIAAMGEKVWVNLSGKASLAMLQLPVLYDQSTTLVPTEIHLEPSPVALIEAVYTAGAFAQVTYPAPQVLPQVVEPGLDDPFTIYGIPGASSACGDPSSPWAFTLAADKGSPESWFSGCGYIGRLVELQQLVFLPVIRR